MTLRPIILVTALMAAMSAAQAADRNGFYMGAGAGAARLEADWSDLGVAFDTSPLDPGQAWETAKDETSGTDVGWQAFIGFRFLNYFAIEGGYVDLGEADDTACFVFTEEEEAIAQAAAPTDPDLAPLSSVTAGDCRNQVVLGFPAASEEWTTSAKTDGWKVSLLGIWPINDTWEVFARVGLLFWDMDTEGDSKVSNRTFAEVCRTEATCESRTITLRSPQFQAVPGHSDPGFVNTVYRGPFDERNSLDGEDVTLGIGTTVHATERVSLRGEFEWFDLDVTDSAWFLSLSAIYQF